MLVFGALSDLKEKFKIYSLLEFYEKHVSKIMIEFTEFSSLHYSSALTCVSKFL